MAHSRQKISLVKWSVAWGRLIQFKLPNHVYSPTNKDVGIILDDDVIVLQGATQNEGVSSAANGATMEGKDQDGKKSTENVGKPRTTVIVVKMREFATGQKRSVTLKEFEERGEWSTGNEAKLWAEASASKHFILPYLGMTKFTHDKQARRWIVTPYMEHGDLVRVLETRSDLCSPRHVQKYLGQVLAGLQFLHSNDIVHGDLKAVSAKVAMCRASNVSAGNILITDALDAVISDFGLSRHSIRRAGEEQTTVTARTLGSFRYTAVEILERQIVFPVQFLPGRFPDYRKYETEDLPAMSKSKENDIWSIGMLILHIFSRDVPWGSHVNARDIQLLHMDGQRPDYPGPDAHARGLDFALWTLAMDCWQQLPRHRPTIDEAIFAMEAPRDLPQHIDCVERCVHDEVLRRLDLTDEIKGSSVTAASPKTRNGYVEACAHWSPPEVAPFVMAVRLRRRDDTRAADSHGWSQELFDDIIRWRRVRHNNLVPLIGACRLKSDGLWYAVSPDWGQYTCRAWLARVNAIGPEATDRNVDMFRVLRDVASAIAFLHMQQPTAIAHGGVHIDNVWIAGLNMTRLTHRNTLYACLGGFRTMWSLDYNETKPLQVDLRDFGAFFREVLQKRFRFPGEDESSDKPIVTQVQNIYIGCIRGTMTMVEMPDGHILPLITKARQGLV